VCGVEEDDHFFLADYANVELCDTEIVYFYFETENEILVSHRFKHRWPTKQNYSFSLHCTV